MAENEKIQTDAILQLFKKLEQDRIPLKIQLKNGDYERVTHIADIRKWKGAPYFLIEYHGDFPNASDDLDVWRWSFEFTDKDNIKYAFGTSSGAISREKKKIWVRFPKIVHRYQRRSLFRLEAPHGTRLYFNVNDTRYKLFVINVSLGGTLGVLVSLTKKMEQELKLCNTRILENVELVFRSQDDSHDSVVNIKQCRIKRHERNPLTHKYECAVEFKEFTEAEQKKLAELFYQWQRDYLRRRKIMKK